MLNSEFNIAREKAETTKHEAVITFIGSQGIHNPDLDDKPKSCEEISIMLIAKTRLSNIHIIILNVLINGDNCTFNFPISSTELFTSA
jgi:hypothetical protein